MSRVMKVLGIMLMVFALLVNPFILAWLFSSDKSIDSLFVNVVVITFECMLFFLGLCVYVKPKFFIKNRKEIMLSLVTFFICAVFFELAVRFFWEEPVWAGYGYPEGLYIPDNMTGYKYKPLFVGNFLGELYGDVDIKINSKGLRDYEHAYGRSVGKTRILGLGDSITFGSGVDYEDTYLRQLEKKFLDNGYDVEIIKAGVNSYEFDQEYVYYFEEGYKYIPDIVLIGIHMNDVRVVNPLELKENMFQSNVPQSRGSGIITDLRTIVPKYVKSAKFIYMSMVQILPKSKNRNEIYFDLVYGLWNDSVSWNNYEAKLLDLEENLRQDNVKLILVYFPNTLQFASSLNAGTYPQKRIMNLSLDRGIPFIDLTPYLDLPNYEEYYLHSDNAHLNGKGYKFVSEIIYEQLIDEKVVESVA